MTPEKDKVEGVDLPADEDVLWRYLSFCRFRDLLEKGQLWFSRIDQFTDYREGSLSRATTKRADAELARQGGSDLQGVIPFFHKWLNDKYWYASCWNCSNAESNLFWRTYGIPRPEDGEQYKVAIATTVGYLLSSLQLPRIFIGHVRYINFETEDPFLGQNCIHAGQVVFMKRREYTGENEVRLAIQDCASMRGGMLSNMPETQNHFAIPVNLTELIREVVVEAVPRSWMDDRKSDVGASIGNRLSPIQEVERRSRQVKCLLEKASLPRIPVRQSEVL